MIVRARARAQFLNFLALTHTSRKKVSLSLALTTWLAPLKWAALAQSFAFSTEIEKGKNQSTVAAEI